MMNWRQSYLFFKMGMLFPSVEVLGQAIIKYCLKERVEIKFWRNDRRIRAYYIDWFPWNLFASFGSRVKAFMLCQVFSDAEHRFYVRHLHHNFQKHIKCKNSKDQPWEGKERQPSRLGDARAHKAKWQVPCESWQAIDKGCCAGGIWMADGPNDLEIQNTCFKSPE